LFLGGERDFNVPVQGGQQLYQALRSLNVDTQLVIYPNEFHGIRDRATCGIDTSATWPGTNCTSTAGSGGFDGGPGKVAGHRHDGHERHKFIALYSKFLNSGS
jgi:Prolyl oligopeptidase family